MAVNYKKQGTDIDDLFVRKDLFTEGGLWVWGRNNYGQLGDNTITHRSSPVQTVAGGNNWKQVNSGYRHMAAIKTDGTLWLWGQNTNGQLGDNSVTSRSSPVQTVSGGTNWKSVSGGFSSTAAIKTDGTLWLWGRNNYGQLGDNTITHRSSPVQTVSGGTTWQYVSAGQYHMAAIKTDGTLWTWGYNYYGGLGDETTANKSSPVQTVSGGTNWKQVSARHSDFTAAIKTDGTLWTWGRNIFGMLGDNTTVNKSSPVQTVAAGTNWKEVSTSLAEIAAIKTDGTLWLWGRNGWGGIGDNTTVNKSSPVQTVSGGTNWKQVSAGAHAVAIKTDGTLWAWGLNTNGQLGDETTVNKSSPVQTVAGGNNWKEASTSASSSNVIREDYY